ncbi:MAG: glycosyltransferase [Myxococcales bacterium]
MRFHVVAPGHTQTTWSSSSCPFTSNAMKFCWMMKSLGHSVWLYAGPGENEAPCDEHIAFADRPNRLASEIQARIEPHDFLCLFHGREHAELVSRFPKHLVVEPAVGYVGWCSQRRVFPSYAWMHTMYAVVEGPTPHPEFFDAVIPHQVIPWDHNLVTEPEDYYVFAGRAVWDKGLAIAEQACRELGARLVVLGEAAALATYGEPYGPVGPEERDRLMGGARALIAPTQYVEPFGLVAVEAQACGTPAVTTDWGGFVETVEHEVGGYRCRSLAEFVVALERCAAFDAGRRERIRNRAIERWSVENVRHEYEQHFERLATLWDRGWETLPVRPSE